MMMMMMMMIIIIMMIMTTMMIIIINGHLPPRPLTPHLSAAQAIHLFGHDWGAAVAYLCAERYETVFTSVTTLAVPPNFVEAARLMPSQVRPGGLEVFLF
jgi:pimeloyl-ACP methyl ester carboxylesterase